MFPVITGITHMFCCLARHSQDQRFALSWLWFFYCTVFNTKGRQGVCCICFQWERFSRSDPEALGSWFVQNEGQIESLWKVWHQITHTSLLPNVKLSEQTDWQTCVLTQSSCHVWNSYGSLSLSGTVWYNVVGIYVCFHCQKYQHVKPYHFSITVVQHQWLRAKA